MIQTEYGDRIISQSIAEELSLIAAREDLLDGTYLNKDTNPYFQEIVKKFHPGEKNRAKLLNPGSYIGTIIHDWEKSFFGSPETNYDIDWFTYIKTLILTAEARLKINVDTETLEAIEPSSYYFDGKTEYFIRLFEKEQSEGGSTTTENYCLLETFHKKVFTRKLFKISGFDSFSMGERVPLDSLEETKDLAEKLTIGLDRLVLTKKAGYSKIKIIETIISSIDRKIAGNEHTILDYGKVWTILKAIDVSHARIDPDDENSPISMEKLGNVLITDGSNPEGVQPGVEIVKNTYENIEASLKIIDSQLMQVSSITGIPSYAFINDVKLGNDSGTAKEKGSVIFYKKIENYHKITEKIFNDFWDILGANEEERKLEFQEIVTTSQEDLLDIESKNIENKKILVDSGFATKEMVLMDLYAIDEKEAQNIINKIRNDKLQEATSESAGGDKEGEE